MEVHERTVGKLLRRLGLSRMQPHPHNPKRDLDAQETFKRNFASLVAEALPPHAAGKPIEIWFQDEARVGQQGTLSYIWAERRSRPAVVRDDRHDSAWLFGAICPERVVGAAVVMPWVSSEVMSVHLAEISKVLGPSAHCVLICDGWHQSGERLMVPNNVTLLRLPPYAPELNDRERLGVLAGQLSRSHRLGHL